MQATLHTRTRFAAYLFVAAIALGSAAPALAQQTESSFATKTPAQWEQLSRQLVASLDSPVLQVRQGALQHINFFATNLRDQIDLDEAVPKLIDIYETDTNEGLRILALTGLHAIGDASVMRYLSETVRTETSPRVRALTLAALADYVAKEQTL